MCVNVFNPCSKWMWKAVGRQIRKTQVECPYLLPKSHDAIYANKELYYAIKNQNEHSLKMF